MSFDECGERATLVAKWGESTALAEGVGKGGQKVITESIVAHIESGGIDDAILWIDTGAKALAMSKHGTLIVQAAVKAVNGNDVQSKLLRGNLSNQFTGNIVDLYKSMHGNHVVTAIISLWPSAAFGFILWELR